MNLSEYVINNLERGACQCGKCIDAPENPEQHQPQGHTADLIFFQVRNKGADKKEFLNLVKEEFPHWLDGNEHSYMELGANIGDQGLALMTMGLGNLLGVWKLLTPKNMLKGIDDELAIAMAGQGMITIKVEGENDSNKAKATR